jgi:hypothetical protein
MKKGPGNRGLSSWTGALGLPARASIGHQ